jgi:hypothetical protein
MSRNFKFYYPNYFLILFIIISCSSNRNNGYEKFMLPENFEGSVILIYGEKESQNYEYKEGKYTIYEILESGIYYTKRNIAKGIIHHQYYRKIGGYYEEIQRLSFPLLVDENVEQDAIYVMDLRPGMFSKRPFESQEESYNFEKVEFISFIVGKIEDREKLINEEKMKLQEIIKTYTKYPNE